MSELRDTIPSPPVELAELAERYWLAPAHSTSELELREELDAWPAEDVDRAVSRAAGVA